MMKKNIKSVAIMVTICSVMALLLATVNGVTAPIIEKNAGAAANAALLEVMPEGTGFEAVNLADFKLPDTVTEAHKETSGGGYVIKLVTAGYGADMVIMCGVSADGKITGAVCLSSNETLGKEKEYGASFTGVDAAALEGVDTIAGATKTTEAYKNAIKDALNAAIILGGGSVDIRDEAQILADNLTAALPDGEGKFQKVFIVEDIAGVDAVYSADNGTGYVCVVGETFIGIDASGAPVTEDVDTTAAVNAVKKIKATVYAGGNLSVSGELADYVLSAKKTATGNFVLETKGAGYGIKGGDEYHPASNEYIVVRVAISKSGKILDCVTVSQAETDGLGSACADESFYGQFDGKTESNYTEIDAIGGATLTTDGYKQAIQKAFDAYKALKGGAK